MRRKVYAVPMMFLAMFLFMSTMAFAAFIDIEVEHIKNQKDAEVKCEEVVQKFKAAFPLHENIKWSGEWGEVVPNKKGSCRLETF